MPVACRLVDRETLKAQGGPEPGDMWFQEHMLSPDSVDFYKAHVLSPEYVHDWIDKRAPLFVCLPNGNHWCVDQRESGGTNGWTVTGVPPCITARPSILSVDYHGWLTDGVLSDDLEGRTYPAK